jgi:hypothetical protein
MALERHIQNTHIHMRINKSCPIYKHDADALINTGLSAWFTRETDTVISNLML